MLFVTYSQTFKIWGKVQVLLVGNVPRVAEGKLCFSGLCHVFLCFLRATWALWTWVCRESITEIGKTFFPLDAAICSAGKCKSCDGETSQDIFLSEWGLFDWVPVPWSICIKLEDVICNFATVRQDQLCGLAWTLPHLSNKGGGEGLAELVLLSWKQFLSHWDQDVATVLNIDAYLPGCDFECCQGEWDSFRCSEVVGTHRDQRDMSWAPLSSINHWSWSR